MRTYGRAAFLPPGARASIAINPVTSVIDSNPRTKSLLAAVLMCVAVVAAYFPLRTSPGDNTQSGGDFQFIHARRMEFAREQLLQHGVLPGWYPRELMGTPFWSNVQSF